MPPGWSTCACKYKQIASERPLDAFCGNRNNIDNNTTLEHKSHCVVS